MHRERISKTITVGTLVFTGGAALLLPAVWIHMTKNRMVIPSGEAPREAIVLGCRPGPGLNAGSRARSNFLRQAGSIASSSVVQVNGHVHRTHCPGV